MRILLFTLLSILGCTTCSYAVVIAGFVFTVNTANISSGSSNSTLFTIPTTGSGYNYSVDWTNSGTPTTTGQTGNATHDFGTAGTYTIRITGTFPRIYFAGSADSLKMISIVQWGYNTNWTSFANAFYGCSNMKISANDVPTLSGVTSLNQMFYNCSSITTGHFSN